jgi:hypothetical protein
VERRFAVHAGTHRQALTAFVAVLLAASPASVGAAPKGRAAKAQFDKGVAAYGKNDYAAASTAFGKSYALEADVETLFAWAQAERKQAHCDKASDLYVKLLAAKLPAENKAVVQTQLDECKRILDDDQAKAAAAARADQARVDQARADQARADQAHAGPGDAPHPDEQPAAHTDVTIRGSTTEPEASPWFKDPAGDVLVGLGIVGVTIGSGLLLSASSADADSKTAPTYAQFKAFDDKAKSRGMIGVIATGAGAALIIGGVIRYATRSTSSESTTVTGWLDGHASGLAITGAW